MLGKKSGLNYETIRERYEHFRARCSISKQNKTISFMEEELDKLKNTPQIPVQTESSTNS